MTSGVQVPDIKPPKKIFFIHIGHPMRIKKIFAPKSPIFKKDIRPEKPDFIGLFHVSEACPRAYKNVDVKRLFYRFSGK